MQGNWIDLIIVGIVGYYLLAGWETGLFYLAGNLIAFAASFWFALRFHGPAGTFLTQKFGVPQMWSSVLGYLVVAFAAEAILAEFIAIGLRRLPKKFMQSRANAWLGASVSAINGLILVTFFLLVIVSLPLRGTIRQDIKSSIIGNKLLVLAAKYGGDVTAQLDQVTKQAVKFLTVTPKSNERILLPSGPDTADISVDTVSEAKMVDLINVERARAGVGKLTVSAGLTAIARAYSRDMFERRYFSHYSPEGKDVGYRLEAAGISFQVAGENLAYAPDVDTAHQGLMNSEGHRRNILDPSFHKIGIGIMDGGMYGKMVTQVFTD